MALGGIDRHHIGPRAPNGLNLRPTWGDVNGTIAIGPLPETHNQGIRAAAAHGANVLRALKPHARGAIAQARLGHGRNYLRIPHGRAFRCLHRDNQARGQQSWPGRRVTHVQQAKGRSSERSGNQARRAANAARGPSPRIQACKDGRPRRWTQCCSKRLARPPSRSATAAKRHSASSGRGGGGSGRDASTGVGFR